MKSTTAVSVLTFITLVAAAPKAGKVQFRNLYKEPLHGLRTKPVPHIIGGQEAEPHSVPSQVFLEGYSEKEGWYCGGSLISENYVMTAAHCAVGAVKAEVTLGAHKLSSEEDGQLTIVSENLTVHAEYNSTLINHDIAVIRLPEPVTFTETIQPAILPTTDESFADQIARISGWGLTNGFVHQLADALRYVDVKVITNDECARDFEILDSVICVSGDEKTGSCNGDSGGPLFVGDVQVGIVSFGIMYCLPGYPSAFTRVSSFLDWLAEYTDVQIK